MRKEILNEIITLRHDLHAFPELSMQETKTKRTLMKFLEDHTSFLVTDRGCWFYAVKYAEREQGITAFRAEMDALPQEESLEIPYGSRNPGVSHKCGHDGHMAALCGLAMELDRCVLNKTVYLIFQPGEETGSGALLCKDLLKEAGITEIYAFHNLSGYPERTLVYHPGTTQPASQGLRIRLEGKASHAAEPEKGNNPAGVIASIALHAKALAEAPQKDMLMCTITGMQVGNGDFGISPGCGELWMTLRSDREAKMKELENGILGFASQRAAESGLHMEYRICDYFPQTRNHSGCLQKVIQAADSAGVDVLEMSEIWRPSEDFGYYLKECPGALFYMGNGETYPAVHTGEYDFNDSILEPVIEVFLGLALSQPRRF